MTLQLVEGQEFAASYSLLKRVHRRDRVENWQALDTSSGERVHLKIFDGALPDDLGRRVEAAISRTRGLVHPNIARVLSLGRADGNDFIAANLVRGATTYDPGSGASDTNHWTVLEQLLGAIEFAAGLGLAHGHLHPGNLLIDEKGELSVTDFGLPPSLQHDGDYEAYLSPEVRSGAAPDTADDIFSLGQILHVILTGSEWRSGKVEFETSRPVPEEIRSLVARMLDDKGWERPKELRPIREALRKFMLGEEAVPLEPLGQFTRSGQSRSQASSVAAAPTATLPREQRMISTPVALLGFAILVVAALALFLVLPGSDDRPASAANQAPAPSAAPSAAGTAAQETPADTEPRVTPLEQARIEQLEERGREIGREILRLQIDLEDTGVTIWGGERWTDAQALTTQADETYRNDEFEAALKLYQQAQDVLEELVDSRPGVKADAMTAGREAMEARDAQAALEAFTIATAIDPDDDTAVALLERAENLETLVTMLSEARFLAEEGNLAAARQTVLSAQEVDQNWEPAAEALARIDDAIDQQRFNDAMSAAFNALGNDNFDEARTSFRQAQEILPGSTEPADGLEQVEIRVLQREIRELREQAETELADYDWESAITTFEAILELDDSLVFARRGLDRARSRAELDNTLTEFIDTPTLLAEDAALVDARRALARAAGLEDPGPRLREQIDRLSHFISLARIPVEVELRSDNRTEVTVYRYGELGRIDSTSIELIPGQYTIVGKRRGYQDVQYDLTLLGGRNVPPIYIACTEEI